MLELSNKYEEELRRICKDTEKYGYDLIDAENESNICWQAFDEFKRKNNIESGDNLCEFSYATEEKEGYTQIATS